MAQLPANLKITYLHVGQERREREERKLAAELRVADQVHFLGVVLDIAPILQAADLFLMPSTHEGFGVAACEAMGAGLPVILSDVEGLRDLRDFGPVHWIEPTAKDLTRALLRFSEMTDADRRTIGRQLSEKAHQHLGIGAGAAQYGALYWGQRRALGPLHEGPNRL
jgi:glycosyltransferase involved in cell wall biosynthesis